MLKQNFYFISNFFRKNVNPYYEKKSKTSKGNHGPISVLPNVSKIYERCIYNQMQKYFDNILSKYQSGFRKGYNLQHCLITMIKTWRKNVDKGSAFGAL